MHSSWCSITLNVSSSPVIKEKIKRVAETFAMAASLRIIDYILAAQQGCAVVASIDGQWGKALSSLV